MRPRRERQERALAELTRKRAQLEHSGYDRGYGSVQVRGGGRFRAAWVPAGRYSRWLVLSREIEALRQRMGSEHFEPTG